MLRIALMNCKAAMPGMRGERYMSGVPQGSVGMDGRTTPSGRIPTALRDRELESFGTPDPRILVCGCGGSGNIQ